MNRYLRRGAFVLVPCIAVLAYVYWAEIRNQEELAALRNREATPPPVVEPLESEAESPEEETPVELTAQDILDLAYERWDTIDNYHCTTVVFLRKGDETDNKVLDVYFKKPSLYRNTVIEGDNQGSVATINAEGVIQGKQGGVFSLIVLTLEPTDERLTGVRGRRFFETAWGLEYQELSDLVAAGWKLERLPDEEFEGSLCYVIEASTDTPETDMTHRQMWFDQETHLPRRFFELQGEEVLRDAKFINVELNIDPEPGTFQLK